jgi:hypothetical protein
VGVGSGRSPTVPAGLPITHGGSDGWHGEDTGHSNCHNRGSFMEVYRIHDNAALYYFTFTVIHWLPVFVSEESCRIITDSLNFCHQKKGLRVNAYVIMPTHMHLVAFDADFDNQRLQQTVLDMRKFTG